MRKAYLLAFMLLAIFQNAFAGEEIDVKAEFKKRKLVVVLQDEDAAFIEKLTKSGNTSGIEVYRSKLQKNNERVMAAFKEQWKETPLEFMQSGKADALPRAEQSELAMLTYGNSTVEKIKFMNYHLAMVIANVSKKNKTTYGTRNRDFKVSLANEIPTQGDLTYVIKKIKNYYGIGETFDRKNLEAKLASKTLYLDKENLGKLNEEAIKESYKFPYKLVSDLTIDSLANTKDKNALYLKLDTYSTQQAGEIINFTIIESETGEVLSRSHMTGVASFSINMPSEKSLQASGRLIYDCVFCDTIGEELFRVYTAKPKLEKVILKHMSSSKTQLTWYKEL
ncbi:hypothetical protein [Adhaeribacter soli]|uniref:Uncharacterized protein n=1 Tax=Adhaeribacter soli TaxID=2607655 RepID=A0A5N1INP0_9BACT|nr:hypothetical protein [Adhaeribacter soli]KAA9325391.1 hypothetical protein F0P94_17530 [Adhaeribacter soli]